MNSQQEPPSATKAGVAKTHKASTSAQRSPLPSNPNPALGTAVTQALSSTETDLKRLEDALQGEVVIDPTQVADLRSLAFRLATAEENKNPDCRRRALTDIALGLPEISRNYSAAKALRDGAQQAMDHLSALRAEHKNCLASYDEKEAERLSVIDANWMVENRIETIEGIMSDLQRELQLLLPQKDEAAGKLANILEDQKRLANQAKLLAGQVKDLETQKEGFLYDFKAGQGNLHSAVSSWERLRARLASIPPSETSVAASSGPAITQQASALGEEGNSDAEN